MPRECRNALRVVNGLSLAYAAPVSRKSAKIAALVAECRGHGLDAHYLGYFECFNRGLYYEAHDVLEELWLPVRRRPEGDFYKGLIQLAGAFVHLQKDRLQPAAALFRLARRNLAKYPATHEHLSVHSTIALIDHWLSALESGGGTANPFSVERSPRLRLLAKGEDVRP